MLSKYIINSQYENIIKQTIQKVVICRIIWARLFHMKCRSVCHCLYNIGQKCHIVFRIIFNLYRQLDFLGKFVYNSKNIRMLLFNSYKVQEYDYYNASKSLINIFCLKISFVQNKTAKDLEKKH